MYYEASLFKNSTKVSFVPFCYSFQNTLQMLMRLASPAVYRSLLASRAGQHNDEEASPTLCYHITSCPDGG